MIWSEILMGGRALQAAERGLCYPVSPESLVRYSAPYQSIWCLQSYISCSHLACLASHGKKIKITAWDWELNEENRKRRSGTVRQDESKAIIQILKIRKICSCSFSAATILSVNCISFNYIVSIPSWYNERASLMSCWHIHTAFKLRTPSPSII